MFNFDFEDFERNKVKKYLLIFILVFFSIIGLFLLFPVLIYIIVILGMLIPSYFLYKIYKNERDEK